MGYSVYVPNFRQSCSGVQVGAMQTATTIGQTLDTPVIPCALFVEMKRPTEIEGRSMANAQVLAVKERIFDNWNESDLT
jgi:hypothetical protein